MTKHARPTLSRAVFREPVFNEDKKTVDPAGFLTPHPSDEALYKEIQNLLSKQVVSFDKSTMADGDFMELKTVYGDHGDELMQQLQNAGQIVFHAFGDSGATTSGKKYQKELTVADQVTQDCFAAHEKDHPSFLFHLGDVVYDFGESQYYFDQFYNPFRNYPGPIFAIPGNHDSFITPNTAEADQPLKIFARNFCNPELEITPEARSLHRTAMTQPGVYFTLDAPYVRIIGLFSNALEDPGVIASFGHFKVPDLQLPYLKAQLERIKKDDYKGAVLIAVHHPPYSYAPPSTKTAKGADHSSSSDMLRQIDEVCKEVGVYPHAFLSGHAHNYQRYTRTVHFTDGDPYDVPFVVCGNGGHNADTIVHGTKGHPAVEPGNGVDVSYLEVKPAIQSGGVLLEKHDDSNYGYLKIIVSAKQLKIGYHQAGVSSLTQSRYDLVTVDLESHTMVAN